MTKSTLLSLISLSSVALLLGGCSVFGSPCKTVCEYNIDCLPNQFEDIGYGSCEWEDDEDDLMEDCMESCGVEYQKASGDEKKEVKACITCVQDELGGSCDGEDWYEATFDDCEDECDDSDVDDFFEDFFEDWGAELVCEVAYG